MTEKLSKRVNVNDLVLFTGEHTEDCRRDERNGFLSPKSDDVILE